MLLRFDRFSIGLFKISETLELPIAAFHGDEPRNEIAAASECLRLWSKLRTETGRAAALDCLRQILREENH